MRFSLKWILAGTLYVAVAAAAFGRGAWYYADALWSMTLLAVVYAILVSAFTIGRQRIVAAGFVVASVCFVFCVAFGSDAVPTARLLAATGVNTNNQPVAARAASSPTNPSVVAGAGSSAPSTLNLRYSDPPAWNSTLSNIAGGGSMLVQSPVLSGNVGRPAWPSPATVTVVPVDFATYLRAANAVAMMTFGLLGSLVGLLAVRMVAPDASVTDTRT
jgi:hypothetical protein